MVDILQGIILCFLYEEPVALFIEKIASIFCTLFETGTKEISQS